MRPEFKHRHRKRFGQNFLQDKNIIHKIINAINPDPEDTLIEIGPGSGAITKPLLSIVNHLTAIEIDRDLAGHLTQHFENTERLTVYTEDALRFNFGALHNSRSADPTLRIIGNLPYNITTPLIFHLLMFSHMITDMHFMLQKEVVDRICARPGSKDYGRLSVMVQYHCEANVIFLVPASAFYPPPKVQSAFIKLKPRPCHTSAVSPSLLEIITRTAFNQRRKTLANALKAYLAAEDFIHLNIDPIHRPEVLSLNDFVKISNYIAARSPDAERLPLR